jgi:hypothetical protein
MIKEQYPMAGERLYTADEVRELNERIASLETAVALCSEKRVELTAENEQLEKIKQAAFDYVYAGDDEQEEIENAWYTLQNVVANYGT